MEPGDSMPHSEESSVIPHIDTYFFNINSNIVLSSSAPVKSLKALLSFPTLATCPDHLNILDVITLTVIGSRYVIIVLYILSNVRV